MTAEEFTDFYPQFTGFSPAVVLTEYIRRANGQFSSFTPEDAEEARRLYTAHQLTLYARSAPPEGIPPTRAVLASAGQAPQRITGKKVGEVSVTYATAASSASGSGLALYVRFKTASSTTARIEIHIAAFIPSPLSHISQP